MATVRTIADPMYMAAVHNYSDAIRGRDEARWLACFAEDAICHDPVGSLPIEGREGLREIWKVLTAPFKAISVVEIDVFYGGSGAAIHWKAQGTGINDRVIDFSGITILEFSLHGKIQTAMSYWDPAAMLIELAGESEIDDFDPSLRN